MTSPHKKWIFRAHTGHIYGPFDKIKVQEFLGRSLLTGEEEVAEYPAGNWAPWASDQELSELLMQNLSGQNSQKSFEPAPAPTRGTVTTRLLNKPKTSLRVLPDPPKALIRNKKLKSPAAFLPLAIIAVALALIFLGLNSKDGRKNSFNLLQPIPKKTVDAAKSQSLVKQGWTYFYKDTVSGYLKAEELFAKAVEESPTNADAVVMLLFTDGELWPFARQDSHDQSVVQWLLQISSQADPYGPRRSLASAAANFMLGNQQEALSQTDSALILQSNEGRLYALKAQNYFNTFEFDTARSYYEKVANLMSYWVKPYFMLGTIYSRQSNGALAQKYLLDALKLNPNHMAARVELGVVEATFLNQLEKAKEDLLAGLNSDEKLPVMTEARGRFRLALLYQRDGKKAKALAEAEKSLSLIPNDPTVQKLVKDLGGDSSKVRAAPGNDKQYVELGDQYIRLKNYLAAQAQYKAALELNPRNATAAMKTGEALWNLHQPKEAVAYLEKAITIDPKFVSAYIKLSDYKTQRFDFDGGSKALEYALKANPRSYEIYRAYAQYFLRRGDSASAENYAKRALSLYETDVTSNEIMSKIQLAKKDMVKAMQYAKRAVDLDNRDVDAQVNFAKIKANFENVGNAQEYLNDLINTFPSVMDYRLALAEVLMQDEQYKTANQVLEQVLAFDNNNKDAYLLSGDSHYLDNDYDKALNDYFSAARIDPGDAAALFRAGEVYTKVGKLGDAQKQFQLAAQINPLFPRVHYNLAIVYYKSGMGDVALKELDEEKKLNPRLADPYELAGDIYLSSRKFAQAAQQYQKAAEIKPIGANIYVKQARAYRSQGSFDAALAMLRLAAAKESGFPEIYREQGLVFEQKGMVDEAEASFKQYLRLEPNTPDKQFILDKIKALEE